ncbi:wall-associated receptor kinase 5 [Corchorus olitorius]|uniref:Wall-associated receptor kinase 5 n=1 Tax=Corchorus olitorius TaxID=93759 RepID=A0A1R3K5M3_9ROSI|nr:wall-associated receptor kinase 5 [Corchorus olitorius]
MKRKDSLGYKPNEEFGLVGCSAVAINWACFRVVIFSAFDLMYHSLLSTITKSHFDD